MGAPRKAYRRSCTGGGGSGIQVGEKAYPSLVVLEADDAYDGPDGESKRPHPTVSLRFDVDIAEKEGEYRHVGGEWMRGYVATEVYKCVSWTPAPVWRALRKHNVECMGILMFRSHVMPRHHDRVSYPVGGVVAFVDMCYLSCYHSTNEINET